MTNSLKAATISAPRPLPFKLAVSLLSLVILGSSVLGALDLDRGIASDPHEFPPFADTLFFSILSIFLAINVLAASILVLLIWFGSRAALHVFGSLITLWLPLVVVSYRIKNVDGALLTLALVVGTILLFFHPQSRQWFDTVQTSSAKGPSLQQPTANNV